MSVPILRTAEELAEIRDKVRSDRWRYTAAGVDVTREVPIAFYIFRVGDVTVVTRGAKETPPDEPTAIIGG